MKALRADQHEQIDAMLSRSYLYLRLGTGVGKLVVMVHAAARVARAGKRALLLVPNSNMEQVLDELDQWPEVAEQKDAFVSLANLTRAKRLKVLEQEPRVVIASHENLSDPQISDVLGAEIWNLVVLDEGSRFRRYSKRTKNLLYKIRGERKVMMSGTLTTRNPGDLWYPMRWLKPKLFGTTRKEEFLREYCILGGYTGMEPLDIRPEKRDILEQILSAISITLRLSDVRDDLPERIFTRTRVDLLPGQQRYYEQLRESLLLEIQKQNDEEDFHLRVDTYVGRMQRLQEIAAGFVRNTDGDMVKLPSAKTAELVAILTEAPVPTIVWTWWIPERDEIMLRLEREGISYTRDYKAFQASEADVLVLQCAAGGYGLNLDRAERMIYHSLPWDLDVYLQSQERNWRYTTHKGREVVHLIARGTIDEHVSTRLLEKATMARKLNKSDALDLLMHGSRRAK